MIHIAQFLHGTVIHSFLKMVVPTLVCVITVFVVSDLSANTTQPYLTSHIRVDAHAQHANTPRQMKVNNSVSTNQTSW